MICPSCNSEFKSKRYPLVCTCGVVVRADGKVITERASRFTGILDLNGRLIPASEEKKMEFVSRTKKRREEKGRAAWKALHEYRGCDPAWVAQWEKTIPNIGCECLREYKALKNKYPLDYSSPDALFVSGCVLHNAVNARLVDKPQIALEDARKLWDRSTTV